jgi:hypothetical protein
MRYSADFCAGIKKNSIRRRTKWATTTHSRILDSEERQWLAASIGKLAAILNSTSVLAAAPVPPPVA